MNLQQEVNDLREELALCQETVDTWQDLYERKNEECLKLKNQVILLQAQLKQAKGEALSIAEKCALDANKF